MKRIKLDETTKLALIENFKKHIYNLKTIDNIVSYRAEILNDEELKSIPKTNVYFSTKAYLKMMLYVRDTSTEIAWHGVVEKTEDGYYITDVMLYPQTLTSVTVNTDQENYQDWLINLDDDTANKLRFQGHSHVNMSVMPSGTDLNYYDDILQTLSDDDFYIFMIMNKSGDITLLIYDLKKNLIYETEDITISITDNLDDLDISREIDLEKNAYCKKPEIPKNYPKIPNNNSILSKNYPRSDQTCSNYPNSIDDFSDYATDDIFDYLDKKYESRKMKRR